MFLQHTSASLTINENADPDVPADLESAFSAIAPEDFPYRHTVEGPDDMPAHVKASLWAPASYPDRQGQVMPRHLAGHLSVRTPHRGGRRKLVLTLWGEKKRKARAADDLSGTKTVPYTV